jgi:hypothetical protein
MTAAGRTSALLGMLCGAALGACNPDNTGTLELFPPSRTATGGTGGATACNARTCAGGSGGSTLPSAGGGDDGQNDDRRLDAATPAKLPDAASAARDAAPLAPGECETEGDCNSGESLCVSGRCAECGGDSDCKSGDRTHCSANQCIQCRDDGDCAADKPGCLPSTHRCEDCSNDAQCQQGQSCDLTQGKCR